MLQTLYYLLFIPLVKIFHTSKCRLAPQECMSEFIVGKSNNADAAIKDDDRDGWSRNNRNRSHVCTSNALNQLKQVQIADNISVELNGFHIRRTRTLHWVFKVRTVLVRVGGENQRRLEMGSNEKMNHLCLARP